MRLLGMMSAAHTVVPLGLLHMRRLQRWFSRLRIDLVRQRRRKVTIPLSVGPDLTHWGDPRTLMRGVPLGRATSHISVFTDASWSGWGGTCKFHAVGGVWPPTVTMHTNALELLTVLKVVPLCPIVDESTRNDLHGQQGDSSIHKSPRGRALGTAEYS